MPITEVIPLEDGKIKVVYTCEVCGLPVERIQAPGFMPRYCEECAEKVNRKKNLERVKRHKQKHKQSREA